MKHFLLLLFLLFTSPAFANDTRNISAPTQTLHSDPAGSTIGQIFINAPLKVAEEKGDWTKVTLTGWIPTKALKALPQVNTTPTNKALTIASFETKTEDSPTKRYHLILNIKNDSPNLISSWKAFLTIKNKGFPQELARTIITDDSANIKPGETKKTSFYWEEGEPVFDVFSNNNPSTLEYSLEGQITE